MMDRMFPLFIVFILHATNHFASSTFDVSSNTEKMYENEKLMCGEHAAIQSIKKSPIDGPDGKDFRFNIKCLPLKVCDTTCEWNSQCSKQDYGPNFYVSGVQSMYIGMQHERYLLLLCCNGTLNVTKCSTTKEYSGNAYVTDLPNENMFMQEMTVNHSPFQDKPFVETKLCEQQAGQNCTSKKADAAGYGMNPATMMFAGAAGAAGFAVVAPLFIPAGNND